MSQIFDILEQCAADNSRLKKIAILEENKENKLFQDVLKAALDPYKQYYIRQIPPYNPQGGKDLEWALGELDKLSSRELTGHAGVNHLQMILESLDEGDATVIERIIGKDLKCGVAESTVSKVIKSLIPSYPVMLASSYNEKNLSRIVFPAYAQTKADGMRANIIVDQGRVEIRSRNGRLIDLLGHFDEAFSKLADGYCVVFDGELLLLDKDGNYISRKIGNGIINKGVKGTISKKEVENIVMVVWDRIPLEDFLVKKCEQTYHERFSDLLRDMGKNKSDLYRPINTKIVETMPEAIEMFNEMLAEGQEGIILKNKDSIWEDKRCRFHVKMKAEKEADLLITDWVEGSGKYEGMLGAITCQTADGDLKVNVGSGFTDDQRKAFKAEDLVGKICAIKYNELIEKKGDDVKSLFLPIFIELREDKNEANKLKELK